MSYIFYFRKFSRTLRPAVAYSSVMNPAIELHGLEVRFGRRVILDKLNGTLSGRAIGLLGPNGAGKSTLINTLLGFHQPWSGTARIFGYDIRIPAQARRVRGSFGYMPENDAFIANMSGVRFVRLMAELSGPAAGACAWSARTRRSSGWDWVRRATATWARTRPA